MYVASLSTLNLIHIVIVQVMASEFGEDDRRVADVPCVCDIISQPVKLDGSRINFLAGLCYLEFWSAT